MVFTTQVKDKNHRTRNDDKILEEDNISHLNGIHYYFHLLLGVRRQRKSRKREEKKLNQKYNKIVTYLYY